MKRFQNWVLIWGLALAGHVGATDSDAPTNYTCTVIDEKGQPVAGATVDCYYYLIPAGFAYVDRELVEHTTTDKKGRFAVSASPGRALAVVKKVGLATSWKTWSSTFADSSDPLVLTAPTTLTGTVVDENNRPVADAKVLVSEAIIRNEYGMSEQMNELFGKPAREAFSARTTADGRFRIENFPAEGRAGLAVIKEGKAQRPIGNAYAGRLDYRSGEQGIELMVGPAGIVEGRVSVADTGQPLAGVKINLTPVHGGMYGTESREPFESGPNGTFRIPDVQPGTFNVIATIPGQPIPDWVAVPEKSQVTVAAGETANYVLIHVSKGALVEVTVVTTNELKPLANAAVWSGGSTAYTDTNGVVLMRVPAGKSWFSARKDGHSQNSAARVEAGRTNHVTIELTSAPRITGIVREQSGEPAPGVVVSFLAGQFPGAPDYAEVTTDKNGRYEMTLKGSREYGSWGGPISNMNLILARSLERNLSAIQEFEAIPTNLDLGLQPGITLTGSVKDPEGVPVTNAMVDLSMLPGYSNSRLAPRPAKVSTQGTFAFTALPQGWDYRTGVSAEGYGASGGYLKAEATKTNRAEFPAFVLKRADRKLAGQVLGPDGKPLAGAAVNFSGQGQPPQLHSAKSNGKGYFEFHVVCEGQVNLSASWIGPPETGGVPTVMNSAGGVGGVGEKAQGGDTNIVIRMRAPNAAANANLRAAVQPQPGPLMTTTGTVLDPSGAPDAHVTLAVWRSTHQNLTAYSTTDGKYSVRWQALAERGDSPHPKPALVGRDPAHNLAAVQDLDETDAKLDLHLRPGIAIAGSVLTPEGAPATNAEIELEMALDHYNGILCRTTSDERGLFSINALPPEADYSLTVRAIGYGVVRSKWESFAKAQSNPAELPPIKLKAATLEVAGTLVGPDDKPLSGVILGLSGTDQPGDEAKTDAQGHFLFKHVADGSAFLIVRLTPGKGGAAWGESKSVRGGDADVQFKLRGPPPGFGAAQPVRIAKPGVPDLR